MPKKRAKSVTLPQPVAEETILVTESLILDEGIDVIQEKHSKKIQTKLDEVKNRLQEELDEKTKCIMDYQNQLAQVHQKHIAEILDKTNEIQIRDQKLIDANKVLANKVTEIEDMAKQAVLKSQEYENLKKDYDKILLDFESMKSKFKVLEEDLTDKQKSMNELLLKSQEYQQLLKKYKSKCTLL